MNTLEVELATAEGQASCRDHLGRIKFQDSLADLTALLRLSRLPCSV